MELLRANAQRAVAYHSLVDAFRHAQHAVGFALLQGVPQGVGVQEADRVIQV